MPSTSLKVVPVVVRNTLMVHEFNTLKMSTWGVILPVAPNRSDLSKPDIQDPNAGRPIRRDRLHADGLVDFSLNYNIAVFASARLWPKLDVFNVLDNRKLVVWNTTVTQNRSSVRRAWARHDVHTRGGVWHGEWQHGHEPERQ